MTVCDCKWESFTFPVFHSLQNALRSSDFEHTVLHWRFECQMIDLIKLALSPLNVCSLVHNDELKTCCHNDKFRFFCDLQHFCQTQPPVPVITWHFFTKPLTCLNCVNCSANIILVLYSQPSLPTLYVWFAIPLKSTHLIHTCLLSETEFDASS